MYHYRRRLRQVDSLFTRPAAPAFASFRPGCGTGTMIGSRPVIPPAPLEDPVRMPATAANVVLLHPDDNLCVAARDLPQGTTMSAGDRRSSSRAGCAWGTRLPSPRSARRAIRNTARPSALPRPISTRATGSMSIILPPASSPATIVRQRGSARAGIDRRAYVPGLPPRGRSRRHAQLPGRDLDRELLGLGQQVHHAAIRRELLARYPMSMASYP